MCTSQGYDSISYYIAKGSEKYNNAPNFEPNKEINDILNELNIDPLMKQHLNWIFIRDPLVIFEDGLPINPVAIEQTIEGKILDKYENIHSTNWNTVRLKIPVPEVCGWRVELRPLEVQKDDFSNAALLIFSNIIVRALLKYMPEFYIPISKLDQNMEICQRKDALLTEEIYFNLGDGEIKKYKIQDIGKFLLDICRRYIGQDMKTTSNQKQELEKYLEFIEGRINGIIPTDARMIRNFIEKHPKYKNNSFVESDVCHDLVINLFA
jgi:glutamate--cysteine ligase catalytic subunit